MVKSYQGVRKEEKKDYTPALVKDYMSKQLITFSPRQTVNEVVNILVYKNISGGPVLDENGKLIGVISEGDCLKEIMRGHYNNDLTMSAIVEEAMVKSVITINANDTIWDAASKFLEKKIRRFPVMLDDNLVGQISQRDVMKAVEELNLH
jgi:CBS domain-containing protein